MFGRRLKHWLPAPLLRPVFSWRSKWEARRYLRDRSQDEFTHIYLNNSWLSGESASGVGSESTATQSISQALPGIIRQFGIGSMLDIPCGDFYWMRNVDLAGVDYVGGDIVKELIDNVSKNYAAPNRRFIQLDLVNGPLPKVDLIFCRDCFIHLPFKMIHAALANIQRSGAKYLLTTTFKNWPFNYDTCVGGHRSIDLLQWPFNLPQPIEIVVEGELARTGGVIKAMGLWPINANWR